MQQRTLCLLVKDGRILLGMKKRGFGQGRYNGFGGKLNGNERLEDAAIRELQEEAGVITNYDSLKKVGELGFTFPHKPEWNQTVHVYFVAKWKGEPVESEEMMPEWFEVTDIPYDRMWDADAIWLPPILQGKYVTASFVYDENDRTIDKKLKII